MFDDADSATLERRDSPSGLLRVLAIAFIALGVAVGGMAAVLGFLFYVMHRGAARDGSIPEMIEPLRRGIVSYTMAAVVVFVLGVWTGRQLWKRSRAGGWAAVLLLAPGISANIVRNRGISTASALCIVLLVVLAVVWSELE